MVTNWFCILLGMYTAYTVNSIVYSAFVGSTNDKYAKYLLGGTITIIILLLILGSVISAYDL